MMAMVRYLAICHPLYSYTMAGLKRTARLIITVYHPRPESPDVQFIHSRSTVLPASSDYLGVSFQVQKCSLQMSTILVEISKSFSRLTKENGHFIYRSLSSLASKSNAGFNSKEFVPSKTSWKVLIFIMSSSREDLKTWRIQVNFSG